MLKGLVAAAIAGASLFAVSPAAAVDFNITTDLADGSASFGNSFGAAGTGYSDRIFFTLPGTTTQTLTAQVSSINNPLTPPYDADFDFTSVGLFTQGGTLIQAFTNTLPSDPVKMQVTTTNLAAGTYYISVIGNVTSPASNGGYSGTVNVFAATPTVPEPATWGLMLLGFGAIGISLRDRRRQMVRRVAA